jgi:hypothetical protein
MFFTHSYSTMYKYGTMYCIVLYNFLHLYYQSRKVFHINYQIKLKSKMAKKYLLTFSLAAISCLGTKSIQSVLVVDHKQQVEIVNNEIPIIELQAELILETNLKIY